MAHRRDTFPRQRRVEGASGLATRAIRTQQRKQAPISEVEARYYLRFDVRDEPGVLGHIATELGRSRISVEQMVQEGRGPSGEAVPILIITHLCKEGDVRAALSKIARADFMVRAPRLLRIEAI